MKRRTLILAGVTVWLTWCPSLGRAQGETAVTRLLAGQFRWTLGPAVLAPLQRPGDFFYSIKDPSVVRFDGRWHLFSTIRGTERSHQVEYLTFESWKETGSARRHLLAMHRGYFCAPQVFYFRPQKKWYLICQASDESWEPKYGAAYATTADIADPNSWSPLRTLGHRQADGKSGLDFWVICERTKAHLFFTTLDGRMWREETRLADFPTGWSEPALAIQGDVFEASHTYRLKGLDRYLTVIEAQAGGRRYYKAHLADRLDGRWEPLAAKLARPFAAPANVRFTAGKWTDSFSHGELIRAGHDERLEVNPANLRFVFQGVTDEQKRGKPYGRIPWRLGLLEAAR